jgi:hypothetical protein
MEAERARTPAVPYEQMDEEPESGEGEGGGELCLFYCALLCSALLCTTVFCSTVHYCVLLYCALLCSAVPCYATV